MCSLSERFNSLLNSSFAQRQVVTVSCRSRASERVWRGLTAWTASCRQHAATSTPADLLHPRRRPRRRSDNHLQPGATERRATGAVDRSRSAGCQTPGCLNSYSYITLLRSHYTQVLRFKFENFGCHAVTLYVTKPINQST